MSSVVDIARFRIGEADFPQSPGAYIVYETREAPRALYVGVAVSQTIKQRWLRQHLKARSGGSALRRSVPVFLGVVARKLQLPERYYKGDVERRITEFLSNCYIEFFPTTADDARSLERRLIVELDPILNVRR